MVARDLQEKQEKQEKVSKKRCQEEFLGLVRSVPPVTVNNLPDTFCFSPVSTTPLWIVCQRRDGIRSQAPLDHMQGA
jgi:hypothetical protein